MSYKLKLALTLAAALALPTIAAAQDPSTRTDITVIGAVSANNVEYVADTHAAPTTELPIVYDDSDAAITEEAKAVAEEPTADSGAELGRAADSE